MEVIGGNRFIFRLYVVKGVGILFFLKVIYFCFWRGIGDLIGMVGVGVLVLGEEEEVFVFCSLCFGGRKNKYKDVMIVLDFD